MRNMYALTLYYNEIDFDLDVYCKKFNKIKNILLYIYVIYIILYKTL